MRHAVIMAGGAGTRLWPLSRKQRPKHFLNLIGGKSLMRIAYERLASFLSPQQINVITSANHLDLVSEQLPEPPPENLIGEPAVRDTANAIGLAATLLHERDASGSMGVFTADHIITPVDDFAQAVTAAYAAAEAHTEALITIGVAPRSAHTGYGYVQRGRELSDGVFEVDAFKEKPDAQTAKRYIDSGDFSWNSGMFVWTIGAIRTQLETHLPDNYALLSRVLDTQEHDRAQIISEVYPQLHKISIDYGIMEKADRVLTCLMNCEWIDVGDWNALADVLGADADGQVKALSDVVTLNAKNNIYVAEDAHLIAAIGVEDLVIVRAAHATLICRRDQTQSIKELVSLINERHR